MGRRKIEYKVNILEEWLDKDKKCIMTKSQCHCGKIFYPSKKNVVYGISQSCGCVGRKKTSQRNKDNRKYNFDFNYFKSIDTPEKAYILGFIFGDGAVKKSGLSIILHPQDISILEKIKREMEYTGKVSTEKYKERKICCLRICSEDLSLDMKSFGIFGNKTNSTKFSIKKYVPAKFYSHFIRGFFDADGNIYQNKNRLNLCRVMIIGLESVLLECQDILKEYCGLKINKLYQPKNTKVVKKMTYMGKRSVRKIYDFLYKDCGDLFLDRKKKEFEKILEERESEENAKKNREARKKAMVTMWGVRDKTALDHKNKMIEVGAKSQNQWSQIWRKNSLKEKGYYSSPVQKFTKSKKASDWVDFVWKDKIIEFNN